MMCVCGAPNLQACATCVCKMRGLRADETQTCATQAAQADVWYAAKMRTVHDDFEDNLVLAAADQAKATLLVTNDQQLIAHAPVAALTPGNALKTLQARFE